MVAPGQATSIAALLLDAGVRILQYRHKGPFRLQNWEDCRALAEMAKADEALFFVNDRADVARMCGASGVHLGQDDLPPAHARRVLHAGALVGFSTHSLEQAREAMSFPVDYLAIGPVFATTTKEKAGPSIGLETVRQVRESCSRPLVAIGGITLDNAASVLAAGADAVAVVRDLLASPDPGERARLFLARLNT